MDNQKKIIITPVISPPIYKQLDPMNYKLSTNSKECCYSSIANKSDLPSQNILNNVGKRIKKFNFNAYKNKDKTLKNNTLLYNAHNNSECKNISCHSCNELSPKQNENVSQSGFSNISHKITSDEYIKIESNVNINTKTTISCNEVNLQSSEDWFSEIPEELEEILDNSGNKVNQITKQENQLGDNILDKDTLNKIDNLTCMFPNEDFLEDNERNEKLLTLSSKETSSKDIHKANELDFTGLNTMNKPSYSCSKNDNETETINQCKRIKTTSIQECTNLSSSNSIIDQSFSRFDNLDNKIRSKTKKKFDCRLKTCAEIINDKNKITDYFPVIKEKKSVIGNNSNECQKSVPKLKRNKFTPPPVKQESIEKRFDVLYLNEKNIIDLENNLNADNPDEITFNVLFKENCCLLSQTQPENNHFNPSGIIIRIIWKVCNPEIKYPDFYFLNLLKSFWNDISAPRNFLMKLFALPCEKLCFKAQCLIISLINAFSISIKEIELNWMILDPFVQYWLLDPDHPAITFHDILNNLQVSLTTCKSNVFDNACMLLIQLSAVSKKLQCFLAEKQLWNLCTNMEMKILTILSGMKYHGILVNTEILQQFGDILKNRIEIIEKKAYDSIGRPFQINSTVQLRIILYDELKLDVKNKVVIQQTANSGAKSTSEAMLQLLENLHPLPGLVLQYRHLSKIKSTYIDSILQHVQNGIIHTTWEQTSAATGRIASCNPNLQAIPKLSVSLSLISANDVTEEVDDTYLNLRSAYVARPGYSFLAADFHHIELRVFAHLSRDKTIINALHAPGDIFLSLTKTWLEVNLEEITAKQREETKRLVYATMYGAGPSKIAGILKITKEEATNVIKKFTNKFPSLKEFSRNTIYLCRQQGFLRSLSGRYRLFPNISNPIFKLKAQAERQAINFRIQGTAADICKSAMIISQKRLQNYDCKLLLQIHDELVWEVLDDQVSHVKEIVKNVMEDTDTLFDKLIKFAVPLPVSVTNGKNLGDMRN